MQWDPPAVPVTQDEMIWVEKAGGIVLTTSCSDKSKRKIQAKPDGTYNGTIEENFIRTRFGVFVKWLQGKLFT